MRQKTQAVHCHYAGRAGHSTQTQDDISCGIESLVYAGSAWFQAVQCRPRSPRVTTCSACFATCFMIAGIRSAQVPIQATLPSCRTQFLQAAILVEKGQTSWPMDGNRSFWMDLSRSLQELQNGFPTRICRSYSSGSHGP